MIRFIKKVVSKIKSTGVDRRCEVAQLTKYNTSDAYDKLWGDQELLEHYLVPARIKAYRDVVEYIIKVDYGPRIVELGFGSGAFLKTLIDESKRKYEVYGLDYAKSGVRRARKLIPEGHFSHGDIYKLPYENDFFDQIYCLQTLEHLNKPENALHEMDRICKPGGIILLTVPNGDLDNFDGHLQFWSKSTFKTFLEPREVIGFMSLNQDRVMMVALKPYKGTSF